TGSSLKVYPNCTSDPFEEHSCCTAVENAALRAVYGGTRWLVRSSPVGSRICTNWRQPPIAADRDPCWKAPGMPDVRSRRASGPPTDSSAMKAWTRHDFLIMAIATAITLGVAVGATIAFAAIETTDPHS